MICVCKKIVYAKNLKKLKKQGYFSEPFNERFYFNENYIINSNV